MDDPDRRQTSLFPDPTLPELSRQPGGLAFDGAVYDPDIDQARLTGQLFRVFDVMQDAQWRTLDELSREIKRRYAVEDPVCSLSAQIRHLRKPKFGGYTVYKRRRGGDTSALWEYQVQVRSHGSEN